MLDKFFFSKNNSTAAIDKKEQNDNMRDNTNECDVSMLVWPVQKGEMIIFLLQMLKITSSNNKE